MTPVTDKKGAPPERLAGPNLEELAQDTGGRAITNTNDLRAGLARISEDLRHYYALVYAPVDSANDGRFRRISVRVSRPGVRVRTRKGYFAAPRGAAGLPADELLLREALATKDPARDLELRPGVLHFGGSALAQAVEPRAPTPDACARAHPRARYPLRGRLREWSRSETSSPRKPTPSRCSWAFRS